MTEIRGEVFTAVNVKRPKATKTFTTKKLAQDHIRWIDQNTLMNADDYVIVKNDILDSSHEL